MSEYFPERGSLHFAEKLKLRLCTVACGVQLIVALLGEGGYFGYAGRYLHRVPEVVDENAVVQHRIPRVVELIGVFHGGFAVPFGVRPFHLQAE